jgi:hypothetical protein
MVERMSCILRYLVSLCKYYFAKEPYAYDQGDAARNEQRDRGQKTGGK